MCSPLVKLDSEMDITPKLLWYPVMNGGKTCGDVLVTAELILRHKVLTEFSLIHFFQSSQLKHLLTTPGTVYLNQREALTFACLFHRMAPTFPFFPRKGHQICTWSPRASGLWFSSLLLRYAACPVSLVRSNGCGHPTGIFCIGMEPCCVFSCYLQLPLEFVHKTEIFMENRILIKAIKTNQSQYC